MSKIEKLLERLQAVPAPRDFRWDDLVTLMASVGFGNRCNGGSHYHFEHESGFRFLMSRTHPGGIMKSYQIKAAIAALREIGAIDGEA